jgi:RimJ/RimL family protein N-acetyltransferase
MLPEHWAEGWYPGAPVRLVYGGLELRSITGTDIDDDFVAAMRDDSVVRNVALSAAITREEWASFVDGHDNRRRFFLGIFAAGSEKLIGVRNIEIDRNGGALQTIVITDKALRRSGVAEIASYMTNRFLFEIVGVERLETRAFSDNEATIAYMKNAQYTLEGTLREVAGDGNGGRRDVLIYGLLRSEWEDRPPARTFSPPADGATAPPVEAAAGE